MPQGGKIRMAAPHLNMIFSDNGVPQAGDVAPALQYRDKDYGQKVALWPDPESGRATERDRTLFLGIGEGDVR